LAWQRGERGGGCFSDAGYFRKEGTSSLCQGKEKWKLWGKGSVAKGRGKSYSGEQNVNVSLLHVTKLSSSPHFLGGFGGGFFYFLVV
jgi:hypothetical protein